MNVKFKKLALSAGITAALGGFSMPSHAIIEGAAGEALLVPFVVYNDGVVGGTTPINTIVELTVPGSVGHDTIPNDFTASHTSPTNPGAKFAPPNPNLSLPSPASPIASSSIHWYFFNSKSQHLLNSAIPVTQDDFYLFDWKAQVLALNPSLIGVKGYLIFGTETARTGAKADFNMFGDAFLVSPDTGGIVSSYAKEPVLPMNDGADMGAKVTVDNQVIYLQPDQIPSQASPLIAGMRTNYSDGLPDTTIFDLTLSPRELPTVHVFWNDINQHVNSNVVVFGDHENNCSGTIPLPNELNVVWISPKVLWDATALVDPKSASPTAPGWIDTQIDPCYPGAVSGEPGFIRYNVPEWLDTNIAEPESAAVAFSFQFQEAVSVTPPVATTLPSSTALGHERGKFK